MTDEYYEELLGLGVRKWDIYRRVILAKVQIVLKEVRSNRNQMRLQPMSLQFFSRVRIPPPGI